MLGTAADTRPIVNIVGRRVALGPLRRDLIPAYLRWFNDFHVSALSMTGQAPSRWSR